MKRAARSPSLLLVGTLLTASHLTGTTCVEVSQHQAFRYAFAVFRGTVEKIQLMEPDETSEPTLVTFRVDRAWKGPVTEWTTVFVFGAPSLGQGYHFREGQAYVVYGTADVPQSWDLLRKFSGGRVVYGIGSGCRLRVREDVENESRRLGRGHAPRPDPVKSSIVPAGQSAR